MDPSILNIVISAVGGLCCCFFWIAVIGGIAYFVMGRNKGGDEDVVADANKALEDKPDFASDAADAPAAVKVEATPGPSEDDEEEDPEDAATVIAAQPSPAPAEKKTPPKAEPPKAEPPKPAPRTSGATIIAFDDDFEDDDE